MTIMAGKGAGTITGGAAICRILKHHGVDTVFCLSGAAHAYLLEEMAKAGITIVSTRTEAATVAAADGYARVKGGFGVAMIAGKQGLPNAMGGVRTAEGACSPVLLLASVHEDASTEAAGDGRAGTYAAVAPYAKYARTIPVADRIAEFVNAAIHAATSGRPGVAVIGLPTHYGKAPVRDAGGVDEPKRPPAAPHPDEAAIARAAELIAGAERPLILAGTGAALGDAGEALRALAALGIPVFGHALGRGLVPEDMTHGFPWPLAQVAARHADVVVSIGMRFSQRIGFGMAPRFAADARFVQVDLDATELGRNRPIDVPIVADAGAAARALVAALHSRGATARGTTQWVSDAITARVARLDELGHDPAAPIHPLRIGRELMRQMPGDTIVVSDGADVYNWMSGVLRLSAPRSYLDHYPLGSMGIGTGLAMGAAAAAREMAIRDGGTPRRVVLITGDGSFGYYTAEFNSMQLAGLPVACIISNDGAWGTEKNGQLMHMDQSVNCELGQCDYELIGLAYGCVGEKVVASEDLAPAIARALASDRPTVLNVLTDREAGLVRKQDKRLQMVTFEDLPSSLDAHHVMTLE